MKDIVVYIRNNVLKEPRIAWKPLELLVLQRKNEISLSVNAKKLIDWVMSSEVLNRETFND